jgi:uncharacterized protein (DUF2062 family)
MYRGTGQTRRLYLKLIRHPGTPESIGRGIAAGLFSAFMLPAGHMFLAFLLAMLVRGARGAAMLATWITNPLTIPFIYPVQCYLGSLLLGNPLSYGLIKQRVLRALENPSAAQFRELGGELIAAFFTGGALLGITAALPGFFAATAMTRRHRARREQRRATAAERFNLRKINT